MANKRTDYTVVLYVPSPTLELNCPLVKRFVLSPIK
jgi:hypothetical protein